jgi:hypothetical protein
MMAWVGRPGAVVVHRVQALPVKTGPQAAALAVPAGSRRSPLARRDRALQGDGPAFLKQTTTA